MRVVHKIVIPLCVGSVAEGLQLSAAVEQTDGEEIVTAHVRLDVEPIVVSHGVKAFGSHPLRHSSLELLFAPGNADEIRWIGASAILNQKSIPGAVVGEICLASSGGTNNGWVHKIDSDDIVSFAANCIRNYGMFLHYV